MADREFRSFEEFWPFYVKQHAQKSTRSLHFVGTTAAFACLAGGLLTKRRYLLALLPVVGYGPAWLSHAVIEKNRPVLLTYPMWSLQADVVMWWKTLLGEMDAELERVLAEERTRDDASSTDIDGRAETPAAPGEIVN